MNSARLSLIGVIVTAVSLLSPAGAQAAIRYVDPNGSGAGGQTWATAYRTIQAAINDAAVTAGSEIRVKQGTYLVTTPILVTKAVRLYGGYSGQGETRNWMAYPSNISGRETVRCLRVTANATIDGFGIVYGYGSGDEAFGGGVAVVGSAATITNCAFRYNWSQDSGGAVATYQANGTRIANCTFQQNTAKYAGGALYNQGGTGLQIADCLFLTNAGYDSAGAILNINCNPLITGCVFQGNGGSLAEEDGLGGAILNDNASPTIVNCIFADNGGPYGGDIFNLNSNAVIDSCWFAGCNPTTFSGGAIFNYSGAPTITNCLFEENSVRFAGAAISDHGSTGRIINCVIWHNSAGYDGGAIYLGKSPQDGKTGNPQFINCTIYANSSGLRGGGICSEDTPSTFTNCIIWGNSASSQGAGIHTDAGASSGKPAVRYSNVQGSTLWPGVGNRQGDPRFVDPNNGDLTLAFDSPCLDAGSNAAVVGITRDFAGGKRVVDGKGDGAAVVDIGALEVQGAFDHLTRGQILRSTAYDDPTAATPTYTFMLRLETDDMLTSVSFQAPGSSTLYTIPATAQTSSGNVQTFHRVQGRVHTWEYWAKTTNASELSAYGDGTYRILANYRNNTQAETRVAFLVPGTAHPIPQPTQRPQVSAPAYATTVPSPVQLKWNPCTDSAANSIYLSFIHSSTGLEKAGAVLAKSATTSGEYQLVEGTYDVDIGFANMHQVTSSDGTPFQVGKTVLVGHRLAVPYTAVFRFWSPTTGVHFYTVSPGERDKLISKFANAWKYEGVAFYACSAPSDSGLRPVYRFWSGRSHFYTISEGERQNILKNYANVWTPEGIAFYAYPEGVEPLETMAVYRFWHRTNGAHFYTISEGEANKLMTQFANVYAYEGVAFYAYPKK